MAFIIVTFALFFVICSPWNLYMIFKIDLRITSWGNWLDRVLNLWRNKVTLGFLVMHLFVLVLFLNRGDMKALRHSHRSLELVIAEHSFLDSPIRQC